MARFFDVKITIKGFQEVQAFFKGTMRRMVDITPPLKKGKTLMLSSIHKNFDQSGRPTWKPLAFSTLKWKIKHGGSAKPLIGAGKFKDGYRVSGGGNLKRSIVGEVVGRNRLVMGTSVAYAPYHQYGTRSIPKRQFLMFQDQDIQRINQLIAEYMVKGK